MNKFKAYKKSAALVAKLTLGVVLCVALLKYGLIDLASIKNISNNMHIVFPALCCLFLGIILSGIRWWILLGISTKQLSLVTVLKIQLIGSFFSTYLPGAAGGDAARGLYVYRILNCGRSSAFISIAADRIFSLIGLLTTACLIGIAMPLLALQNDAIEEYSKLASVISSILFVGLMGLVWTAKKIHNSSIKLRMPLVAQNYLEGAISATRAYKNKLLILFFCWFLSTIASCVVIFGIVLIAKIFSFSPQSAITAIAAVFGNLSSAIPITPGGIGVGEAVFSKICTELSNKIAPFATIYFTFRIGMLLANLPGLIVYFFFDTSRYKDNSEVQVTNKASY